MNALKLIGGCVVAYYGVALAVNGVRVLLKAGEVADACSKYRSEFYAA